MRFCKLPNEANYNHSGNEYLPANRSDERAISRSPSLVFGHLPVSGLYFQAGFDAHTSEYLDRMKVGVIDPTKVVRLPLKDAASVAGLVVTTEDQRVLEGSLPHLEALSRRVNGVPTNLPGPVMGRHLAIAERDPSLPTSRSDNPVRNLTRPDRRRRDDGSNEGRAAWQRREASAAAHVGQARPAMRRSNASFLRMMMPFSRAMTDSACQERS